MAKMMTDQYQFKQELKQLNTQFQTALTENYVVEIQIERNSVQ